MHPIANVGLSATASQALVTILVYLVALLPSHPVVPADVSGALTVLIAIGSGYLLHTSTQPAAPVPAAPAAPPAQ